MAEVLAAAGKMSKELFDYNRDVFKFDQMQRLQRDILRMEMQIARFQLFREDIRDLVELTVGKMEMYHLVGALFMEFCIAFYVEGKIERKAVPVFSIALYYMSVAGAFLYLIMTVWLSMHASISSHSFGVRLLCRYIRLPLPGAGVMSELTNKLAEYENEAKTMFRVPFLQRAQALAEPQQGWKEKGGKDYLDQGELPYMDGESGLLRECKSSLSRDHVTLFRRLQAKWQCFDAYARVSMCLGANQILMSVAHYLINVTMVSNRSPTACFTLILVFAACSVAVAMLDIAGIRRWQVVAIQSLGVLPCILAACILVYHDSRDQEAAPTVWTNGRMNFEEMQFKLAPLCFFLEVLWLESFIWVAAPSKDEATLPRRFRAVLFLDVFGDASHDPGTAEVDAPVSEEQEEPRGGLRGLADRIQAVANRPRPEHVNDADDACELAHQALRRWEAVPVGAIVASQRSEVQRLRHELRVWRSALRDEVRYHAKATPWFGTLRSTLMDDTRVFADLTPEDLAEDSFRGRAVGPVEMKERGSNRIRQLFWQPEDQQMLTSSQISQVLTLQETGALLVDASTKVRAVISHERASKASGKISFDTSTDSEDDEDEERRSSCCYWPATNSNDFSVPQRLPWKVLKYATRLFQLAWFFQGVMLTLEEMGYCMVDHIASTNHPISGISAGEAWDIENMTATVESRRLGPQDLRLENLRVAWRRGEASASSWLWGELSCLGSNGTAVLLGGEAGLVHTLVQDDRDALAMAHFGSHRDSRAPDAHVCAPAGRGCLFARMSGGGFDVWLDGERGEARVELADGRPWRHLAGAQAPCSGLEDMLLSDDPTDGGDGAWCLLVAGWDGQALSVGAVALRAGPGSLPNGGEALRTAFELPLDGGPSGSSGEPIAMHLEAGRLWALLGDSDSSLLAWDLTSPRRLGRWSLRERLPPRLHGLAAFEASGVCETGQPGASLADLLVAGRGGDGRPALLRAAVTLEQSKTF